jgi:hypothetical protein
MQGFRPLVAVLSIVGLGTAVSAFAVPHAKDGSGLVNRGYCGVERWAVKTLTDSKASLVKRTPKTSSVARSLGSSHQWPFVDVLASSLRR